MSTSPTGRMERVAAVPHRHLVGLVEQAHGVDAEVRAHARDLAAVGDDGDAGGLGVGRPLELLEHEVLPPRSVIQARASMASSVMAGLCQ